MTTPGGFAVLFVPQSVVEDLGGEATVPQVLVKYEGGTDRDALDAELTTLANASGAQLVQPARRQPSNGVIQEELTGFREASIVIPALALIVATLVAALACAAGRRHPPAAALVGDHDRRVRVGGVVIGGAALGGPDLATSVNLPEHVGANNWPPRPSAPR